MQRLLANVLIVFLGAVLSLPAAASGNARAALKQLEMSMTLTGTIDVEPDGSVSSVLLHERDKITPAIYDFVHRAAMDWRFEPVLDAKGTAGAVRAPMQLRLVARDRDDGEMEVAVRSATFAADYDPKDPAQVRYLKQTPPHYPEDAVRAGVTADVYVAIKIDRDGAVVDVATRQVNLHQRASERAMNRWRNSFAKASERGIRDWRFKVPTEGEDASDPFWVVTAPISFRLVYDETRPDLQQADRPGVWHAYLAGPLLDVSWCPSNDGAADTVPEGGLRMGNEGVVRLVNPIAEY